jgi:uncharacterized membrane protein
MKPTIALLACCLVFGCQKGAVSYREQVQPIFNERCIRCHSPEHRMGKIVLTSYESLTASKTISGKGALFLAGEPQDSRLYILCATSQSHFRMPPDTTTITPLTTKELEVLRDWIRQGGKNN